MQLAGGDGKEHNAYVILDKPWKNTCRDSLWSLSRRIIGRKKPKYSETALPQCYFTHHKSHMDCPGIVPTPSRLEATNYSSELCQGLSNDSDEPVGIYLDLVNVECFKMLMISISQTHSLRYTCSVRYLHTRNYRQFQAHTLQFETPTCSLRHTSLETPTCSLRHYM
jgi:hypothetical protein